jgi:hypothetical protein
MLLRQQDDNSKSYVNHVMLLSNKMTVTFYSILWLHQKEWKYILTEQGDKKLLTYQSCHAIVKQVNSHMINLAPVLFVNMTATFMDITKCS